ncbi:putative oxidoreductase [Ekhidna lutea]|uniref:Putative oxidoreductase n=1 Tax=Ekhidna lutea TaxID=447679 RepID=A0A239LHJ3_EKHLU|nr:DoxX family protein [Ekhidna lutea]SNT29392.1 putative oxidoreductase [Ekhidna lutea]
MDKLKKYADLPIRLTVGFHLIYGTQDNVFSWDRMLEFRDFLEVFGAPFPLFSAIISVYAQFICGILFIIGWKVRIAGIIMIFNFIVAILLVHLKDPYPNIYPAISMLAGAIFMSLYGMGDFSLENEIRKATN